MAIFNPAFSEPSTTVVLHFIARMSCKSKCGGGSSGSGKAKSAKDAGKVDVTTLEAYKALAKKFGDELGIADLVTLAQTATDIVDGLKSPTGAEKKNRDKLYQWFQNNWAAISPKLDDLELEGEEEEDDEGDDDDE
jgi:hypothetical protein